MANPYSTLLWQTKNATAATFTQTVGTAGFRVVVTDMRFYIPSPGLGTSFGQGFSVGSVSGQIVWSKLPPYAAFNANHHWRGRWVLPTTNSIYVQANDIGWSWWISGFNLSP